ncbi:unnamed protein product [Vitrella brassicaformis CCMP3155]|uniref:RZ-type domain-containing protein n=4 Tax=Vitrella brassicaformis TaxID=1169539 RepID=A0A0G4F280_VITBC|nr:unnamed protein product [Vitrella brassicaformis CCMP3155]|eukprot:CEM05731.1 unnamed protein product [Vitrella brassicaformis CCMP3155]
MDLLRPAIGPLQGVFEGIQDESQGLREVFSGVASFLRAAFEYAFQRPQGLLTGQALPPGLMSDTATSQARPLRSLVQTLSDLPIREDLPFVVGETDMDSTLFLEVASVLYYMEFSRKPAPWEVLFLTSRTATADLNSFLERWAESHLLEDLIGGQRRGLFMLCCVEVSVETEQEIVSVIMRLREELRGMEKKARKATLAKTLPMLILQSTKVSQVAPIGFEAPMAAPPAKLPSVLAKTFPSRVMHLDVICGQRTSPAEELIRNVGGARSMVYATREPCTGKTRTVLFECAAENEAFCTITLNHDVDPSTLHTAFRRVEEERTRVEMFSKNRTAVGFHLSVSPSTNGMDLNNVLSQLVFVGRLVTPGGDVIRMREGDRLHVELPSNGVDVNATIAHLPICRLLPHHAVTPHLEAKMPLLLPVMDDCQMLYRVREAADTAMLESARMLRGFLDTLPTRALPSTSQLEQMAAEDVDATITEVLRPQTRLQLYGRDVADGIGNEPRLLEKVRLVKFISPALRSIMAFDTHIASAIDAGEQKLVSMFKHLLANLMLRSAIDVAAAAVEPPPGLSSTEDGYIRRFDRMMTFQGSHLFFVIHHKDSDGTPHYNPIGLHQEGQSLLASILAEYPQGLKGTQYLVAWMRDNLRFSPQDSEAVERETLVSVDKGRRRIWELFHAPTHLRLLDSLTALEELQRKTAVRKDDRAIQRAYETAREAYEDLVMGEVLIGLEDEDDMPTFESITDSGIVKRFLMKHAMLPEVTVTLENLVRLISVEMRMKARMPVILQGETGCGKTQLVQFLSRMLGASFFAVNVHGGMKAADFEEYLRPAIEAARNASAAKKVYVLLDEANSSSDVWSIKRRWSMVSSTAYRLDESMISYVWDFGSPAENVLQPAAAEAACHRRTLFLDKCMVTDESLYAEAICAYSPVEKKLRSDAAFLDELRAFGGTETYWRHLRTLIVALVSQAQYFVRHDIYKGDTSAVSLRDIRRCIDMIPVILDLIDKKAQSKVAKTVETGGTRAMKVSAALQTSLTICYALRLPRERRPEFAAEMTKTWESVRGHFENTNEGFFPVPNTEHFEAPFFELAEFVADQLIRPSGIALNHMLLENTLTLLVAIITKTAIFLVGKPGTSKSLSMELLSASMSDREHPFWSLLPSVTKKTVQCSPLTTPHAILQAANHAAKVQLRELQSDSEHTAVLVLEEIGETVLSPHNPLMTLHGLIDHGVNVDGKSVKIAIVAISKWKIDPAKMNRGVFLFRGTPSASDLSETAFSIISSSTSSHQLELYDRRSESHSRVDEVGFVAINEELRESVAALSSILELKFNDREYNWYYGSRDMYALLTFLHGSLSSPPGGTGVVPLDLHLAQWAIERAFGEIPECDGVPQPKDKGVLLQSLTKALASGKTRREQPAAWQHCATKVVYCNSCATALHQLERRREWAGRSQDDETERSEAESFLERFTRLRTPNQTCKGGPTMVSRIAWNLNDEKARHLLLITDGAAGHLLLFQLGLAHFESTKIIIGSQSSDDAALLQDLQKIQLAMRTGQLVVLVNCFLIFSSLLDMLNQHYKVEAGRRLARLSMHSHSRYFPVHRSFRCVVVCDRADLKRLTPPFLNRFEKVELTMQKALTLPHDWLMKELQHRLILRSSGEALHLGEIILPGFDAANTLQSLVLSVLSVADADQQSEKDRLMTIAMSRLVWAARTCAMLEMMTGRIELLQRMTRDSRTVVHIKDRLLETYFSWQVHDSLTDVQLRGLQILLGDKTWAAGQDDDDDLWAEENVPWGDSTGLQLCVLTEQSHRLWSAKSLKGYFSAGQSDQASSVERRFFTLDGSDAMAALEDELDALFSPKTESSYLYVLCDQAAVPESTVRHALFWASEKRKAFKARLAAEETSGEAVDVPTANRHLIFISQQQGHSLVFTADWHVVYCDEVLPTEPLRKACPSLRDFLDRPAFPRSVSQETREEGAYGEAAAPDPDRPRPIDEDVSPLVSLSRDVPRDSLSLSMMIQGEIGLVVSSLYYPSDKESGQQTRSRSVDILKARLDRLVGLLQLTSGPMDAVLQRCVEELAHHSVFHTTASWLDEAQKMAVPSKSTRGWLFSYLRHACVTTFVNVVAFVDRHSNLDLLVHQETREMWMDLFRCPAISGSAQAATFAKDIVKPPGTQFVSVENPTMPTADGDEHETTHPTRQLGLGGGAAFNSHYSVEFPFSWLIAPVVRAQMDVMERGANRRKRLSDLTHLSFPMLTDLPVQLCVRYVRDVLSNVLHLGAKEETLKTALVWLVWALQCPGGDGNEEELAGLRYIDVHLALWIHDRLFLDIVKLARELKEAAVKRSLQQGQRAAHELNAASDKELPTSAQVFVNLLGCEAVAATFQSITASTGQSYGLLDQEFPLSYDGLMRAWSSPFDAPLQDDNSVSEAESSSAAFSMAARLPSDLQWLSVLSQTWQSLKGHAQGARAIAQAIARAFKKKVEELRCTRQHSNFGEQFYFVVDLVAHVAASADDTSEFDESQRLADSSSLLLVRACRAHLSGLRSLPDEDRVGVLPQVLHSALDILLARQEPFRDEWRGLPFEGAHAVPVNSAVAASLLGAFFEMMKDCSHDRGSLAIVDEMLSCEIDKEANSDDDSFAVLLVQCRIDWLHAQETSASLPGLLQQLPDLLLTAAPLSSSAATHPPQRRACSSFWRLMVFAHLKLITQLAAKALKGMVTTRPHRQQPIDQEALRNLLDDLFVRHLRPAESLTQLDLQRDSIIAALSFVAFQCNAPACRHSLVIHILRSLSNGGTDLQGARRILKRASERLDNPGITRTGAARLFLTPSDSKKASMFALQPCFVAARRTLMEFVSGVLPMPHVVARLMGAPDGRHTNRYSQVFGAVLAAVDLYIAECRHEQQQQQQDDVAAERPRLDALEDLVLNHLHAQQLQGPHARAFIHRLLNRQELQGLMAGPLCSLEQAGCLEPFLLFCLGLLCLPQEATGGGLGFFLQLFARPDDATTQFLPGVAQSRFHEAIRAFPPAFWVYTCPKRHPYVTGECHHISSQGTCIEPGCGAPIGGLRGQLQPGNRQLGNVQSVLANWNTFSFPETKGYLPEPVDPTRTERSLHPALFRVLRFCLSSTFVMAYAGTQPDQAERHAEAILTDIRALKRCLFANDVTMESTSLALVSAIQLLLDRNGGQAVPAAVHCWPLTSLAQRQALERALVQSIRDDFVGRQNDLVAQGQRAVQDAVETLTRNDIEDAVRVDLQYVNAQLNRSNVERLMYLPRQVKYYPPMDQQGFWLYLDSQPDTEGQFGVLQCLKRHEQELQLLCYLPAVLRFFHLMRVHADNRMTSKEAADRTLDSFLDEIKQSMTEALHRAEMERAVEDFTKAWKGVWPYVKQWDCVNFDDGGKHAAIKRDAMTMDLHELRLSMFLPSKQGLGIASKALYSTLAMKQRSVIEDLRKKMDFVPLSLEATPFKVTEDDLLIFRSSEHLLPFLPHYVHRDYRLESSGPVEYRFLKVLQSEVIQCLRITEKPMLAAELPSIRFLDTLEGSLFSDLDRRIPQDAALPIVVQRVLRVELRDESAVRESLFHFVHFLATMCLQTGAQDMPLSEFAYSSGESGDIMRTFLNQDQQRARSVLLRSTELRSQLQLRHLRALAASLWSGNVHHNYNQAPVPDEKAFLDRLIAGLSAEDERQPAVQPLINTLRQIGLEQLGIDRVSAMTPLAFFTSDVFDREPCPDVADALQGLLLAVFGPTLRVLEEQLSDDATTAARAMGRDADEGDDSGHTGGEGVNLAEMWAEQDDKTPDTASEVSVAVSAAVPSVPTPQQLTAEVPREEHASVSGARWRPAGLLSRADHATLQ